MQKSNIVVGLLAAAALVVGLSSMQSSGWFGGDAGVSAAVGSIPAQPVLVTYSDDGFVPAVIKIARGTSIRFINTSRNALRIAPLVDPAFNTEGYKGFAASKSVSRGESFEISVTLPGVWGYKNLNNPGLVGVVVVE